MTFGAGRTLPITRASGNLDRRGLGDVKTLTVREYLARSLWRPLLSALPASNRHVRHRPGVSICPPTAAAGRNVALRRLAALAEHHGDQFCYCARRRRSDLVRWRRAVFARAFADHVDRWLGRGVAILRAAPV